MRRAAYRVPHHASTRDHPARVALSRVPRSSPLCAAGRHAGSPVIPWLLRSSAWPRRSRWHAMVALRRAASRATSLGRQPRHCLHAPLAGNSASRGRGRRCRCQGLPWTSGNSYYRGQRVFRMESPVDEDDRFAPLINLQQNVLESYLVDAIEREPLVEMRWGNKLVGLTQDAHGRGAANRHARRRIYAAHAVACRRRRRALDRAYRARLALRGRELRGPLRHRRHSHRSR